MLTTEHITRYRKNGKMGLKYKQSKSPIIPPLYNDIQPIEGCNYYVKVRYGNKWGVIDCSGKSVLGVIFDAIVSFDFDHDAFLVISNGASCYKKPEIIEPNPPERHPYSSPIGIRLGYGRKRRR